MTRRLRAGIDLGGSKIAVVVLSPDDQVRYQARVPTPHGDYGGTLAAIRALVEQAETAAGASCAVGLGMPGSISPATGLVQNSNSTWLNGKPFREDLAQALGRPLRLENDANCFALSEAHDGAAAQARVAFGVILGTGCGGSIAVERAVHPGRHGIGGEWGHTPLPWPQSDELPGARCWCGRGGCLEVWISGPGLSADHMRRTGASLSPEKIAAAAGTGDADAQATLQRHAERLARGLAVVVNILDPDVIVLGGGLSGMTHLYETVPEMMRPHVFADHCRVAIRPPRHGPESGVRGAARLWRPEEL